jgi:nucleoside-diphosphate-sugar epimerase
MAQLYAPHGLQIIRPSMPYGPMMPVGRGCCALVNFLWWAATDQQMTVHSTGARAWCWVGDLVRAVRIAIERGEQADSAEASQRGMGIFNVGRDDNEVSMVDVARLAVEIAGGSPELVNVIDPPKAQTAVKRLSMQKVRDLGYTPEVELEQGMRWVFEHDFAGKSVEELLAQAPQHRLSTKA